MSGDNSQWLAKQCVAACSTFVAGVVVGSDYCFLVTCDWFIVGNKHE